MRLLGSASGARLPQRDYRTRPQDPGISTAHSGVSPFQDETLTSDLRLPTSDFRPPTSDL